MAPKVNQNTILDNSIKEANSNINIMSEATTSNISQSYVNKVNFTVFNLNAFISVHEDLDIK